MFVNGENVTFDSFGVDYIPKEILKIITIKNKFTNLYRIQVNDSIMYEYACIGFIEILKILGLIENIDEY